MTILCLERIHELLKEDRDNKQKALDQLNADLDLVDHFMNIVEDPNEADELEQEKHNIETARNTVLHNLWEAQDFLKEFEAEEF